MGILRYFTLYNAILRYFTLFTTNLNRTVKNKVMVGFGPTA
jgi:hypothetical protein